MLDINSQKRPDMKFIQMDATAMSFTDESFSVALDKGTLDALFVDDTENTKAIVERYFSEILRTMRLVHIQKNPSLTYFFPISTAMAADTSAYPCCRNILPII